MGDTSMGDTSDSDEIWLSSTEHLYVSEEMSYVEEDEVQYEASVCDPTSSSIGQSGSFNIDPCNQLNRDVLKVVEFEHDELNGIDIKNIRFEDVRDIWFEDIDAAGKFYNYYAHARGFSTRKHKMYKSASGLVCRREWLCSKAGYTAPKNANFFEVHQTKKVSNVERTKRRNYLRRGRRKTRCGCTAKFVVKWSGGRKLYYVSEFVTEHNHYLFGPSEVHFCRSHRNVEGHDAAQIRSLMDVQVPISRAYEFLAYQAGGYSKMRFTLKDMYNKLRPKNRPCAQGDADSAVKAMRGRVLRETEFFFHHSVDTEGRLQNMFWRDQQSLKEYTAYGDVLIIDSTYKTNKYSKPLVLFVGCNNHRASVVFGIGLVADEKEETFYWLLNTFLVSMKEKKPVTVITDGDEAMRNVFDRLLPETRHRLCAWHIGRNIGQNLKSKEAKECFSKLMFASLTVPDWETQWSIGFEKYHMENKEWLQALYRKRNRWAEAYFHGHFCAGMCSTQRCEGMNCQFKKRLDPDTSVSAVVGRMEWKQRRLRDRNLRDNFNDKNSTPVLETQMKELEQTACRIFTHDIFIMIRYQMSIEGRFVVHKRFPFPNTNSYLFYVGQYDRVERRWSVEYRGNKGNPLWLCSCKMFESDGIPCAHLFCVFRNELVSEFPSSLVKKRWTREVGETTSVPSCLQVSNDRSAKCARYASLLIEAGKACLPYSESPDGFNAAMKELEKFKGNSMKYKPHANEDPPPNTESEAYVRDPLKSTTKGMASTTPVGPDQSGKMGRRCSKCKVAGHNSRSCKKDPPTDSPDLNLAFHRY